MLYIYFHHAGQILKTGTRNSLIKRPLSFDSTVYLNLELLISHSVPTSLNPCQTEAEKYDVCIQNQYLELLRKTNSCLLPFLKQQSEQFITYCETLESGFKALTLYQKTLYSCPTPCLLVYADLTLQNEEKYITNYLTRYSFTKAKDITEESGLFIHLPREIELIESQFNYSLFSSIANFLGVACLFFGLSAFGCFEYVKDSLTWTANIINFKIRTNKFVKIIFFVTLLLASTILIILILVVFIRRYLSLPTDTNVALTEELPNMSMSFCSSSNITQLGNGTIKMWREAADIRKQVSDFSVINIDGKPSIVWDKSFPISFDERIFKSIIFPLNNKTLQFCKTYDLHSYAHYCIIRTVYLSTFINLLKTV
jgi:hypothetical protein